MRARAAAAALAAGLLLAGCGVGSGGSGSGSASPAATTVAEGSLRGGAVNPPLPAPELGLRDVDGKLVRIADLRGRVALVTFVYTHCPDVCPLIADNLRRVKVGLGPAGKRLALIAVSVDPKGDTPASIRTFLRAHRLTGRMQYLHGTRRQLEAVWARWGIAARVPKSSPELVEHTGVIWGIDTRGRRVVLYPAVGFKPSDIDADMRTLLGA